MTCVNMCVGVCGYVCVWLDGGETFSWSHWSCIYGAIKWQTLLFILQAMKNTRVVSKQWCEQIYILEKPLWFQEKGYIRGQQDQRFWDE